MTKNTRRMLHLSWIAIALLVVVYVAAVFTGSSDRSGPSSDRQSQEEWAKITEGGFIVGVDPSKQLEYYKNWAKYPPFSRPLEADQIDLLEPNRGVEPATPVVKEWPEGCPTDPTSKEKCSKPAKMSDVACSLSLDKRATVGTEDQKVFIECHRERDDIREAIPVNIKELTIVNQTTRGRLPPAIHQGDDGQDGDARAKDGIYTAVVRPRKADWGWLLVGVRIIVEGMEHSMTTGWYSTPHTVAEFLKGTNEEMKEGHLQINVPVLIHKAGTYSFHANLKDRRDQTPIASSDWKGHLEKGTQTVPLIFFGKIIHEKGLDGPYQVTQLRGHRINLPIVEGQLAGLMQAGGIPKNIKQNEPEFENLKPGDEFVTRDYLARDFSDHEWTSVEKDDRIRFLEEMVAKGEE